MGFINIDKANARGILGVLDTAMEWLEVLQDVLGEETGQIWK